MNQSQAFHFLRPEWLWLLAVATLLYFLVRQRQDISKSWQQIIAPELLENLLIRRKRHWRFRPIHAACLTIALGSIGMSGPTWSREKPPFTEDKAPLVIALDLSQEMDAIDVQPTRLERAKLKITDLLELRSGSLTAIFVYSSSAHMVVPLTSDKSLIGLYVQSLSSDLLAHGAKDTAGALGKIDKFLQNETVPGTILFITCGVERAAFPALIKHRDARNQVLVLGIGTSAGGPIRISNGQFLAPSGHRVFSKLDISELAALKEAADVPVSTVTLDDGDIRWVQRHAFNHLQSVQQRGAQVRWIDQGYWLVIPTALLGALWFRKGWVIRWTAASALLFSLQTPIAQAGSFRRSDFHFVDLWMTRDQQGRYYFEKGDYATASKRFQDHLWKGLALARQGNYAAALDEFALIDSPESWFNQGNALAFLKRYPEAVKAYDQALHGRPGWREAEENLALIQSLIPKPKKPDKEQQQYDPNLKPDQIKFDEKGKGGKKGKMNFGKEQMADVWMRNIQISPADFLRRKFAVENAEERHR